MDSRRRERARSRSRRLSCRGQACCQCGTGISKALVGGFLSPRLGAVKPGSRPLGAAPVARRSSPQKRRSGLRSSSTTAVRQRWRPSLAVDWLDPRAVGTGSGPGVATAVELIGKSLDPVTSGSYQSLWEAFERFCAYAGRTALPSSPATVGSYLRTLFEGERLRGTSLRPYVAAIGAQHLRLALPDPISHVLLAMARRGLASADARRRGGAPPRSAAYPAGVALSCLRVALRAETTVLLRYWAAVTVGFLLSARPASICGLSADEVRLEHDGVLVELRVLKYGSSGFSPRVAICIPAEGESDEVRGRISKLLATTTRPSEP
jgi:hypothetical protein